MDRKKIIIIKIVVRVFFLFWRKRHVMIIIVKVNHPRKFAHSHIRAILCVMAFIGALTQMVIQAKAIVFFLFFSSSFWG